LLSRFVEARSATKAVISTVWSFKLQYPFYVVEVGEENVMHT
jgi:hypothetical protein